ncbi:hypothetical protein BDB01DRAFT_895684 [Pilobolus umbonatus]|nr:hypothetical protein BDB01DRAFT_895684 [Pilobolus umbonatus]
MSDFDIVNFIGGGSFLTSLKKRKAFGLDSDSEEEEEDIQPKRVDKKTLSTTSSPVSRSKEEITIEDEEDVDHYTTPVTALKKETSIPFRYTPEYMNSLVNKTHLSVDSSTADNAYDIQQTATTTDCSFSSTEASLSVIDIDSVGDKEDHSLDLEIDDLDPDLAEYLDTSIQPAEPQKLEIKIQYVIPPQPNRPNLHKLIDRLKKPIKIIVMDNEQFDKLLTVFCQHKKLNKNEVVLVYQDDRVFLTGTPAGIGMTDQETHTLLTQTTDVYPLHYYNEKLREEELEKEAKFSRLKEAQKSEKLAEEEGEEEEGESVTPTDDKIIVKLRGKDNTDTSLRVKQTTLIRSVISSYKKIKGIHGDITLSFEGEALPGHSTIQDAQLENEDIIEVNR